MCIRDSHGPVYRKKEREMDERAMDILKVFDLDSHADTLASNLPYGQQRKLEIARALATNPKLLLLDEPAAGMNPNETAELMDTIRLIREKYHITILPVSYTHLDVYKRQGMIIAVNKWDAIEKNDKTIYEFTKKIRDTLAYMPYAEMLFISAKTGQRLNKLYDLIDAVRENQNLRVATGVLNEIMTEAVALQQPPSDKGKRLKLYYITQVAVKPPTFVIFVNDKELMHFSYTRYIENKIREAFGFRGTSLRFIIRERSGKEK